MTVALRRRLILNALTAALVVGSLVTLGSPAPQREATQLHAKAVTYTPPAAGWATVTSGNQSTSQNNYLYAVSCDTVTDCWAVGNDYVGGFNQTLIEHFTGSTWSVVTSPDHSASDYEFLTGVVCLSSSSCWASGYYVSGGVAQTLIETYNGSSWTIQTTTNPSASYDNFQGIACASASFCVAVGTQYVGSNYQTLVEKYNGSSWSTDTGTQNTSTTKDNELRSVSCPSPSDCWAVGYAKDAGGYWQPYSEQFTGSSWNYDAPNYTSTTQNNYLYGISCVSTSVCWAAGDYSGTYDQTLIEKVSGTTWTAGYAVNANSYSNDLNAITCTNANDCMAVGSYCTSTCGYDQSLVEQWDGTSWYLASPSNNNTGGTNNNALRGVACVAGSSPDNCSSVGNYCESGSSCAGGTTSNSSQTLTEQYGGPVQVAPVANGAWASAAGTGDPSASSPTAPSNIVGDVNLESGALHETATDINVPGRGPNLNVSRTYDAPQQTGMGNNTLYSTACVTSSDCWAVGFQINATNATQTLIEYYNGTAWTTVPSPSQTTTTDNFLQGVSCVSATDCWVVGEYQLVSTLVWQTLIEQYAPVSGSACPCTWSIVSSPNTSTSQSNEFENVNCISSTSCSAVGYIVTGTGDQTLAESWNGTSWAIVTSYDYNTNSNILFGTSCVTASNCWAAGGYVDGTGQYQTMVQQWNGTSYTQQTAVDQNTTYTNSLLGISCTSASNCWAAGYYDLSTGVHQTLAETWNGTSWSLSNPVNTGTHSNVLYGIYCVSSSDCWTDGGYTNSSSIYQTLIEQYTTSWSNVTAQDQNTTNTNSLLGITCASSSACWAVGYYNSAPQQVLVEQWNSSSWSIPSGTGINAGGAPDEFQSNAVEGPFGWGWSSDIPGAAQSLSGTEVGSAGMTLFENSPTNTQVTITDATGAPVVFTLSGGVWSAPTYNASTLTSSGGVWTYTRWDGYVYTFNSSGNITSLTDRNGNSATFAYTSGQLSTISDATPSPNTRSLTLTWTGGQVSKVEDPDGQYFYYYYDGAKDLTQVKNQAGNSAYLTYDGNHDMLSVTDFNGNATIFSVSLTGQLLSETDPLSHASFGTRRPALIRLRPWSRIRPSVA
jgi:YD repeat-containing protein